MTDLQIPETPTLTVTMSAEALEPGDFLPYSDLTVEAVEVRASGPYDSVTEITFRTADGLDFVEVKRRRALYAVVRPRTGETSLA